MIPPDMGVSQNTKFWSFARSLNSLEAIGEIVLVSQITVPLSALSNTPFFSHNTYATSFVFGRDVIIKSTPFETSEILFDDTIPFLGILKLMKIYLRINCIYLRYFDLDQMLLPGIRFLRGYLP